MQIVHQYAADRPSIAAPPPAPALFIGRDQDVAELKRRMGVTAVGNSQAKIQVLTAVRGWPGVGKTSVAAALANDSEINLRFPDGVLWVSLGENPNLISSLAVWGRAFGIDDILKMSSVRDAAATVAGLLHERRALLFVDDVWQVEHAAPFLQARGPQCGFLVTTRDQMVAAALSGDASGVYHLGVLRTSDAMALLRALAPAVVDKHPDLCEKLVTELECLPLALQVAGHLLNRENALGWSVEQLLSELRDGTKLLDEKAPPDRIDLENQTIPTVAVLLRKSTDRLDEVTRTHFAYLGAFAPKPATFDLDAMKEVWSVHDPRPSVRTLVDRGLLEAIGSSRYQMHSLLVSLARSMMA
jgi:hypothetical protein